MKDPYGREMTNLRISVTQRCNLKCAYCHREGESEPGAEMTPDEIGRIVSIASALGMHRLKITGGEPLVREDIADIVGRAARSASEVSMTTNGVLLSDYSRQLKAAGLKRVNVSVDTLRHQTYESIAGLDVLDDVMEGIRSSILAGLSPVKLNMVVMRDVNLSEVEEMIRFSSEVGAILQLIELETSRENENNGFYARHHYPLDDLEDTLAARAVKIVPRSMHRRMKYFLPQEVEVVRPMHNTVFCANCHRLRVTSNGLLKPCLMTSHGMVDVLSPIRKGAPEAEIAGLFEKAVLSREPYWR